MTDERVAIYLSWWFFRLDLDIDECGHLPLFAADPDAHKVARENGYLSSEIRGDVGGLRLTDNGSRFCFRHYPRATPAQLPIFHAEE